MKDQSDKIEFLKKYSFATLVTSAGERPVATHLPFYIDDHSGRLQLVSHFALANPQAKEILLSDCLVIFSTPHAYISPRHYEREENVPTWNYIAVHAYGKAKVITDKAGKLDVLEKTITFYEPEYLQQWNGLAEQFKDNMLKGIVAFSIEVEELQGKEKLSQNKSRTEQHRIMDALSESADTHEKSIAEYMSKQQTQPNP